MPAHRHPRRRKTSGRALVSNVADPVARVGGESIALNVNPNRGKRHLSTLGHVDPRTSDGSRPTLHEKTVTRHRPIRPRAHRSVAWRAAELHRTSDAVRYAAARPAD